MEMLASGTKVITSADFDNRAATVIIGNEKSDLGPAEAVLIRFTPSRPGYTPSRPGFPECDDITVPGDTLTVA